MRRYLASPALVLPSLVAIAAFVALPLSVHGVNRATATPTTVATVDYSRVVQQLAQFRDAQARVNDVVEGIRAEDDGWRRELEAMLAVADDETTSADARRDARENYSLKALEYQAWSQVSMQQIDIEQSILLQEVDRAIMREVKSLCEIGGYDLVITDDSSIQVSVNREIQVPREEQIKAQMSARRVLYSSEAIDITDELILRMNNQFNAGRKP